MKQKIYTLGLLNTLIIFAGAIFKFMHWPGAGILLTIGITTLVTAFLPIALINSYKSKQSKDFKLLYIITWITCLVVFTAMLFKIQHWPYAGIALFIALPFPYLVFLPVFLATAGKNRNTSIYDIVYMLFLLVLNSVFSALLSLNVTYQRIEDSINIAVNYNRIEDNIGMFSQKSEDSAVCLRIDKVLEVIDEYRSMILTGGNITKAQWKSNPALLQYPDSRQTAYIILSEAGENHDGNKLEAALYDLENTIRTTPGFESLSTALSSVINPSTDDMTHPLNVTMNITGSYLGWGLIYLDQLETNLKIIKATL